MEVSKQILYGFKVGYYGRRKCSECQKYFFYSIKKSKGGKPAGLRKRTDKTCCKKCSKTRYYRREKENRTMKGGKEVMQKLGGRCLPRGPGWTEREQCSDRREAHKKWREYKGQGLVPYIRKIGNLKDEYPYRIYTRQIN